MRTHLSRWALVSWIAALGTTMCPVPVLADPAPRKAEQSIGAAVRAFSSDTVRTAPRATARREQSAPGSQSFFQTRKGALAIGLMVGGAAFTAWSINHDRKPVKSPVR